MKLIRRIDFVYTLFEDECGSFVLELIIPSENNAWAIYEKRVVLSPHEKSLIEALPERADHIANKLIDEEKCRQ
jgi:hypothetical protein